MKLQGALRGGAAGLSCGLAARDGQKRTSPCTRGRGGRIKAQPVHRGGLALLVPLQPLAHWEVSAKAPYVNPCP